MDLYLDSRLFRLLDQGQCQQELPCFPWIYALPAQEYAGLERLWETNCETRSNHTHQLFRLDDVDLHLRTNMSPAQDQDPYSYSAYVGALEVKISLLFAFISIEHAKSIYGWTGFRRLAAFRYA